MSHFKSEFFNIMLERGFYNQCTNEEGFDQYLSECEQKGTPAVGYLGSDPTGDSLHVGHIVPLMICLLYTSPSPRDGATSRMPSSA